MIINTRNLLACICIITVIYSQHHWETAVYANDNWTYLVPESELPSGWNTLDYNDSDWSIGPGGFGYGDEDDGTEINQTISVYFRRKFVVDNTINFIS